MTPPGINPFVTGFSDVLPYRKEHACRYRCQPVTRGGQKWGVQAKCRRQGVQAYDFGVTWFLRPLPCFVFHFPYRVVRCLRWVG